MPGAGNGRSWHSGFQIGGQDDHQPTLRMAVLLLAADLTLGVLQVTSKPFGTVEKRGLNGLQF